MSLWVRTREVADPGDLLARLPDRAGLAMITDGEGLIGWGEALRLSIPGGPDRFARAARALEDAAASAVVDDPVALPGSGLVAFLAGTFAPDSEAETTLVVPERVVGRRDGRAFATAIGASGPPADPTDAVPRAQVALADPPRVRERGAGLDEVAWLDRVAKAVDRLRAGELGKVVLARDVGVWADEPFDPRAVARRLAARFPGCHTVMVDGMVGASPELLVGRRGPQVRSRVLAGTTGRDADPERDAALARALRDSRKDREEHDHAVASARAALEPVCAALEVDPEPWVLRLANVAHLATDLRGALAEPVPVLDLVQALHPTAAVCGTPTALAAEVIAELEGLDRGRYAGPIGWVCGRGEGEVAIALRCAEVAGSTARLFAGAGIMPGSRPESELEETRLKLEAMRRALGVTG